MVSSRRQQQAKLEDHQSRWCVSVCRNVFRARTQQCDHHPARHRNRANHRHYFYLLAVVLASPANAETIGGVSATAAPTATSSGSVTNQAVMIAPSAAFQNTYGNGIQCQGPTLTVTPYVNRSKSYQLPYVDTFPEPVYDLSDLDEDGVLDNPGRVLYTMPTRTGQKDTHNWSGGLSIQATIPLDGGLQERCKAMVDANIRLHQQIVEDKRLSYEIARLKNCGELKLKGIEFHPKSPYFAVCADVMIKPKPGQVLPHRHAISAPPVAPASSQIRLPVSPYVPAKTGSSSQSSSQQVSQP